MMRNKLKYLVIFLFAGIITSCQDAMDIPNQPGTVLEDMTFNNVQDLQFGLNFVYNTYSKLGEINFNAVFTDNVKNGNSSAGQNRELYNHLLMSTTSMTD